MWSTINPFLAKTPILNSLKAPQNVIFSGGRKWKHRTEWINKVSGPQFKTTLKQNPKQVFLEFL